MPLPIYLARPDTPYTTKYPSGSFDNRYTATEDLKLSPKGHQLDGDILWLRDVMVDISKAVNNLVVGILPGIDSPGNKDHFPTTDGEGNLSWVKVQNFHIEDKTINAKDKIIDASISTELLANQCVTAVKIRDKGIPLSKINADLATIGTVPTVTQESGVIFKKVQASSLDPEVSPVGTIPTVISDGVVNYRKVQASSLDPQVSAIGTIPTVISDGVVNYRKVQASSLDPQAAAVGTIPTVISDGVVAYQPIPISGKVLQRQKLIHNVVAKTTPDGLPEFRSFDTPFTLSITPLSQNSVIHINITINISACYIGSGVPQALAVLANLYRNDELLPMASGVAPSARCRGALFGGIVNWASGTLLNYSTFLIDETAHVLQPIKYEIKGSVYPDNNLNGIVTLNAAYDGPYKGAVCVSSIYLTEVAI